MKQIVLLMLFSTYLNILALGGQSKVPVQIHLSYTAEVDEMCVTWLTTQAVQSSHVVFGLSKDALALSVNATDTVFVDGGTEKLVRFIHSATMRRLKSGNIYYYRVGSEGNWSPVFFFQARVDSSIWNPTFAVFGDMGFQGSEILPGLQADIENGAVEAILHIGDFAYDMDNDNGRIGDGFMEEIQPVSARVPYMTCPGNHEPAYNFSNYRFRFVMPTTQEKQLFYSFDIGGAHIVSINTEAYYYDAYKIQGGSKAVTEQYQWLIDDLQTANGAKQRQEHPWIIVVGHRPMYCSNNDGPNEHCNNLYNNPIRTGYPVNKLPGLEDIFYKYGVDLQFYAHEHSYERLWPVYNLKVCNGSKSPYEDPEAPVHVITGSGGNREGQTQFDHVVYPWSGFHSDDFGYTRMKVLNSSVLRLEQVSTKNSQKGTVIDSMKIVKSKHGANIYKCHENVF